MSFSTTCIQLLLFVSSIAAYKVLVFNPAYGASHANFLGKISDLLIDAGHDVTMVIPVYLKSKKDLVGSVKVKKIVRIGQNEKTRSVFEAGGIEEILREKVWTIDPGMMSLLHLVDKMNVGVGLQCEYIFQQQDVLEQLRNENFDLAIAESLFICPFAVFEHIGIKTVINAESHIFKDAVKYAHGEPAALSYYPGLFSSSGDKMGFFARANNFIIMMFTKYLFSSRYQKELETIEPYYNGSKSWHELLSNVAFSFVNSSPFIDYASPTLPKTIFVGGMQVNTNKQNTMLSKDWDTVLSARKQNVLISFGSNAHSSDMPEEFKESFLEVFASMPDTTFIWKYEKANATLADHLPNVKLTTWMPQNELLADSRLSLFVTHGGLGSTMELAYLGKPALIIPLLADQPRNAHMLSRHGGSLLFDKSKLGDSEQLRTAIQKMLNDSKYAENANKLAEILKEQPSPPKEMVVKHCDFAVAYGNLETLNSEGRHLSTFEFHSMDILLVIIIWLFVLLAFISFIGISVIRALTKVVVSEKKKLE